MGIIDNAMSQNSAIISSVQAQQALATKQQGEICRDANGNPSQSCGLFLGITYGSWFMLVLFIGAIGLLIAGVALL